jgi:formate/nitrite transporter
MEQPKMTPKLSTMSLDEPFSETPNPPDQATDVENPPSQQEKRTTWEQKEKNSTSPSSVPVPTTISLNYKATKAPKETLLAVYKTGEYKAGLPLNLLCIQCFMAGIYISMGGHLYLAVGGGILGAAMFPTGLIAVILTSAELFTGDALVFVASVLGRKVSFGKLVRNWTVAWIMNFAGSLFWAALLAYASGSLEDLGKADLAVKVALKKANQPWMHIFIKGIGANFMVCIGIWQATCAEEVAGKVLALWFPIAAFVMMGFDHCIANQFLIPVGMMLGADISISHLLFRALLPATLGNIVGGGVMVGAVYWYVYDAMASSKELISGIREGFSRATGRKNSMMLENNDPVPPKAD